MADLKLVIGTKNLSSWSLRPWWFMRQHQVPFEEILIDLDQPGTHEQIQRYSPSGKVPVLVDGDIHVWESLAICEYVADRLELADAWPREWSTRAHARALAYEMHAGFSALRQELPFDATRRPQPLTPSEPAMADIERIRSIWRECRTRSAGDGEWLFGAFGIVDAMFAPVAVRFHIYAVPLEGPERDYVQTVLASGALREWIGGAFLGLGPALASGQAAKPAVKPTVAPIEARKPVHDATSKKSELVNPPPAANSSANSAANAAAHEPRRPAPKAPETPESAGEPPIRITSRLLPP